MKAAAVATINPVGIPGLGLPLEKAHMSLSRPVYNALPYVDDQSELQYKHSHHIKALLDIIGRYSMGDHFRIHSAHRHEVVPDGTVRLEEDIGIKGLKWTRATATETLVTGNVHATFFKVVDNGLVPFEFAKGPSPVAVGDIPANFLSEVAAYLTNNELTDLMAIEWGKETFTVVIPDSLLTKSLVELIPTGWNLKPPGSTGPGIASSNADPDTHWVKVIRPKDTHRVYCNSVDSATPQLLVEKLVEMGLMKS